MVMEHTVFYIDDDFECRKSITALLTRSAVCVKTFSSASDFEREYDPALPGCIIHDIQLPDANGLELLQHIRTESPHHSVIILTADRQIQSVIRGLQLGAVAYLLKPVDPCDLRTAVQTAFDIDAKSRAATVRRNTLKNAVGQLTEPEWQVFNRVVDGQPNKRIAKQLNVSRRTVEERRARVMRKLGVKSLPELIRFAVEAQAVPPLLTL